ncbi:MAG: response regulator [Vulcanimicrobiota bacterium]
MIRLLIVDDHDLVRSGLRGTIELEDDFEVVGEAASGEEALARLEAGPVDVVLMDVMMPGMGGIAACREVGSRARVLMLTSSSDDEAVMSSLIAGAAGYLLKNVGRDEIVRSIRLVAEGKTTLDPAVTEKVTARLVELVSGRAAAEESGPLSGREIEVVELVARGMTNRQIAEQLVIAEKTARNHVSRILEKLGLTRRSQAAAWAMRQGLVD